MRLRKRWGYSLVIVFCAMMLLGLEHVKSAGQENTVNTLQSADKQLAMLLPIAQQVMDGPAQLTVKWQGMWNTLLSPEEAAGVLSTRLGLPKPQVVTVQNHIVYSTEGNLGTSSTKLSLTAQGKDRFYVVLRLESRWPENLAEFASYQKLSGESLADEGVEVNWNVAFQGIAVKGQGMGDEAKADISIEPEAGMSDLERRFDNTLTLKRMEGYEDGNTVSRSYNVPEFPIFVLSGKHRVSLQVAIHRNAETGRDEVSIGSPLLTVEY